MDIIYNGEIYLKKGPEIYNPSADIKEIDEKIEELQKLFTEDPNLFTLGVIELSKSVKSSLEKERGKLDYSGTDTFWRLYTNDGINLLMKNNFQERKYNGVEEMKRIYMKLSEFLNESSFIGKEFVRTTPIRMNGMTDTSYTSPLKEKNIVLYANNDLFLAVKRKIEQDKLLERYILINSNYIKDRNYEFYGNIYSEYKDKTKVYKLIRRQLEKEKI